MSSEDQLKALIEFGTSIYGKKTLIEAFEITANFVKDLLKCDRCSLYLYDKEREELWTIVAHGLAEKIILSTDEGIVGQCSKLKEVMIIDDAYANPFFNRAYDLKFNYKTSTVLTIPIINKYGDLLGVIQALNKHDSLTFTKDDSALVMGASEYIAVLVENATYSEKMDALLAEKTQALEDLNRCLEERVQSALSEISQKDSLLLMHGRKAAMGEMIGVIAHQWKQPLSTQNIIGSLLQDEIERGKDADFEKVSQYVTEMKELSTFMAKTIDDFRHFFNPNKKLQRTLLDDLVDEALKIISKQLGFAGIVVDLDIRTDTAIQTYKNELMHVVLNILKNAHDILLERKIKEKRILVEGRDEEAHLILEIRDNGGGIAPENLDKVFSHYFSTKDEKSGTGLGLYISKIIVEEHAKGKLSVSNTDEGACFTIKLPKQMDSQAR